jgi:hypothetical protein
MQNLKPYHFREIAAMYFNKPELIKAELGICWHLSYRCGVASAYVLMDELMHEINYGMFYSFQTEQGDYQQGSIEQWQSRAYMCLILAEYLENK